jgi:hypothetical protein
MESLSLSSTCGDELFFEEMTTEELLTSMAAETNPMMMPTKGRGPAATTMTVVTESGTYEEQDDMENLTNDKNNHTRTALFFSVARDCYLATSSSVTGLRFTWWGIRLVSRLVGRLRRQSPTAAAMAAEYYNDE